MPPEREVLETRTYYTQVRRLPVSYQEVARLASGTEIAPLIAVERTLRTHIAELNRIIHQLNEELMHEDDLDLRNALEAKVRAAQTALRHYQTALELEQSLLRQ